MLRRAGRPNMSVTQRERGSKFISPGDAFTCRTIATTLMARINVMIITKIETLITLFALRIAIVVCMSLHVALWVIAPSNLTPGIEAMTFSLMGMVSL